MERWILSFILMAIETWGSVYFFGIFMERKRTGWLDKCRYAVLYFVCVAVASLGELLDVMGIKVLLIILLYTAFCAVFYKANLKQCIFFPILNYSLLFLTDLFLLQVENMLIAKEAAYASKLVVLSLPAKLFWVILLFILRRIWKGKDSYGELSIREWWKFSMVPLFSLLSMLLMYFCYSSERKVQAVYLFLAAGLIMINLLVMVLMQDILAKGALLRESVLTDQKKESQLAHYRDMQAVYEQQGRKLHDYKNQIRTMQVLLKDGDVQASVMLAERLTESISVEMAVVNTNHPVVNAVLNQKFHTARELGVSMIFKLGDMMGMRLDEEEIVILISNLLDNAINECERVVRKGSKAVIKIKLVQESGKLIFSVRNPVAGKADAVDSITPDRGGGLHGVGLMNVKTVVNKYGGSFAISCDDKKFQATVMI